MYDGIQEISAWLVQEVSPANKTDNRKTECFKKSPNQAASDGTAPSSALVRGGSRTSSSSTAAITRPGTLTAISATRHPKVPATQAEIATPMNADPGEPTWNGPKVLPRRLREHLAEMIA